MTRSHRRPWRVPNRGQRLRLRHVELDLQTKTLIERCDQQREGKGIWIFEPSRKTEDEPVPEACDRGSAEIIIRSGEEVPEGWWTLRDHCTPPEWSTEEDDDDYEEVPA